MRRKKRAKTVVVILCCAVLLQHNNFKRTRAAVLSREMGNCARKQERHKIKCE